MHTVAVIIYIYILTTFTKFSFYSAMLKGLLTIQFNYNLIQLSYAALYTKRSCAYSI